MLPSCTWKSPANAQEWRMTATGPKKTLFKLRTTSFLSTTARKTAPSTRKARHAPNSMTANLWPSRKSMLGVQIQEVCKITVYQAKPHGNHNKYEPAITRWSFASATAFSWSVSMMSDLCWNTAAAFQVDVLLWSDICHNTYLPLDASEHMIWKNRQTKMPMEPLK